MTALTELPRVRPATRAAWRRWLSKHHARTTSVWLVLAKKHARGRSGLTYADAVEEALCWGWVDSRPGKFDDTHYLLLLSPRKPRSVWSAINKRRVAKLIREGLMAPPGLARIEVARRNGSWTSLEDADRLVLPADLRRAFAARPPARRHFDAFPAGVRKQILWWITSAKRAETRAKRVAETVRLAATNVRANQWRAKEKPGAGRAPRPRGGKAPPRDRSGGSSGV